MIILDFDGVLFNAEKFKADQMRVFRRFGISYGLQRAAYIAVKAKYGGYRDDKHLAAIQKELPSVPVKKVQKEIDKLLVRSRDYLYRDVRPFLVYWHRKKQPMALVSAGFALQKKKVAASGLTAFFRPVIVTGRPLKVEPIQKIVHARPEERIIFLDDKKEIIDAVKKNIPSVFAIHVARASEIEQSRFADVVVRNLAHARTVCEKALSQ